MSKGLNEAFIENNQDVDEDTAAALIVQAEQKIKALEDERAENEHLANAKQIVKDLNAGFSSAIKYEKAKIKFLLERIEEIQSGDVNPSSGANL
jgi:hypothetical protein